MGAVAEAMAMQSAAVNARMRRRQRGDIGEQSGALATASCAARIDVAAMRGLERAQQCRQRSSCGLRREDVRAKSRESRASVWTH